MNKTTIIILQELIRNQDCSIASLANKLKKAKTTIYDCFHALRAAQILNQNNQLTNNELTTAFKQLILSYPYDFSFLTTNDLKILFLLQKPITFKKLLAQTKLSRFTINQLLKQLKSRGFVNKQNQLIAPKELVILVKLIKKSQENISFELPPNAVIISHQEDHDIILSDQPLPLKPTAFSALNAVSPHYYYTTKKKLTLQGVFNDAKTITSSKREELITALFYKKNRKRIKKDDYYEQIINTQEFKEFEHG
ncbi:winged helix-turn-helix domain-containing protein [Candidatus Woesearchaeota archaeon]|nr:winged helix-turn-helix domain-containing protein [Candidatus Woesearchaeota archaeon]